MSAPHLIERQASDWLTRRAEGELPEAEERVFQQWLAADTRHVQAFQSLEAVWGDVGEMKHLGALAPLDNMPSRRSLWLPWAAAAAIAMMAVGAFLAPRLLSREAITTRLAEVRDVVLPDGSRVTVGALSAMELQFDSNVRRVVLKSGEGFFDIARDASRPFIVEAGGASIRVLGTQFDVHRSPQAVRVAVAEGKVEVRGRESRVLAAGERAEVRQGKVATLPTLAPRTDAAEGGAAVSAEISAWRFGRLVYDDRQLSELVADANRYYSPGIELAAPNLGSLRVTAAFRTDEIPPTLAALTRALPITAEYRPDGHIVLRTRVASE